MAKNVARKVASQAWGEVQHQRKLAEGIWLFNTAGHGGIVTDTNLRPDTKIKEVFVYMRNGGRNGLLEEQHFAAFEEDCDANMVEWLYAEEIMTERFKNQFVNGSLQRLEEWKESRLSVIKSSLNCWHPEFLKKYPVPNMGSFTPGSEMF